MTVTDDQPHATLASAAVSVRAVENGPRNQDSEPVSRLVDDSHRIELDLIPRETLRADDQSALTTGPPRFEVWMEGTLVASYAQEALLRFRVIREAGGE